MPQIIMDSINTINHNICKILQSLRDETKTTAELIRAIQITCRIGISRATVLEFTPMLIILKAEISETIYAIKKLTQRLENEIRATQEEQDRLRHIQTEITIPTITLEELTKTKQELIELIPNEKGEEIAHTAISKKLARLISGREQGQLLQKHHEIILEKWAAEIINPFNELVATLNEYALSDAFAAHELTPIDLESIQRDLKDNNTSFSMSPSL